MLEHCVSWPWLSLLPSSYVIRSGLPPSITDPYDSASDSEEEDEADEDSNGLYLSICTAGFSIILSPAEEYYKNDYPEEDDPSDSGGSGLLASYDNLQSLTSWVDEFHEDSEDDEMNYNDDGDDHEWRWGFGLQIDW